MTQTPNWVDVWAEWWREFSAYWLTQVAPEVEWFMREADMPFGFFYGNQGAYQPGVDQGPSYSTAVPLAERIIGTFDTTIVDVSPGRRLRVLAALVIRTDAPAGIGLSSTRRVLWPTDSRLTYAQFLEMARIDPELKDVYEVMDKLPLRIGSSDAPPKYDSIPAVYLHGQRDWELHYCLQDLADEISEDVREACFALDNPNMDYWGVDEGIEPVPDDHVDLVIWALQRELRRELRAPASTIYGSPMPAVELADLPRRVQRALVERRRLRYAQWGIGREQWETGWFSLWNIPEDPDYVPRRSERLLAG